MERAYTYLEEHVLEQLLFLLFICCYSFILQLTGVRSSSEQSLATVTREGDDQEGE